MESRKYDLFLDESGSFDNDAKNSDEYKYMSLVGGLLCEQGMLTNELVQSLLPEPVHCCKHYAKRYLDALEALRRMGAQLVIFQNVEQIQVVNGDVTYLNILTEGLFQLLTKLKLSYPEDAVQVNVYIATRKKMSSGSGIIDAKDYISRVKEKMALAKYRANVEPCGYSLQFGDARKVRQYDFADIICNTYFTRNARKKFTDGDRVRIEALYANQYVYRVFEGAVVAQLKQLLSEGRCSEMIYQISTLPNLFGVKELHEELLRRIVAASAPERAVFFQNLALQIRLYIDRRLFSAGIEFAENYKKYFLDRLRDVSDELAKEVAFWIFDTNFYIITLYNHIGNVAKCAEYLEICNQSIHVINHSWEHIDYYFNFRIRELNCLKGCFAFDTVLEKVNKLLDVLSSAKELFDMIDTSDGTTGGLRSELLGKAYGVKLETYINLVGRHPELLDEAIKTSDLAMAEFTAANDLQRQYQNRSMLMLAAGKPEEALDWLLRVYELNASDEGALDAFLACVYRKPKEPMQFPLWHYADVMLALGQAGSPQGKQMFDALMRSDAFRSDITNTEADASGDGYPRNMTLWCLSRWYRMTGSVKAAETYYNRAMTITQKEKTKVTMYTFSISMLADHLLWEIEKNGLKAKQAETQMARCVSTFCAREIPESMRRHFEQCEDGDVTTYLKNCSTAYLK